MHLVLFGSSSVWLLTFQDARWFFIIGILTAAISIVNMFLHIESSIKAFDCGTSLWFKSSSACMYFPFHCSERWNSWNLKHSYHHHHQCNYSSNANHNFLLSCWKVMHMSTWCSCFESHNWLVSHRIAITCWDLATCTPN